MLIKASAGDGELLPVRVCDGVKNHQQGQEENPFFC